MSVEFVINEPNELNDPVCLQKYNAISKSTTSLSSISFRCTVLSSMLLKSLSKICVSLNFIDSILWIYAPSAADLLGRLKEKGVIYHCIADFANEKKNRIRNKVISCMEREIALKSDIILTLTQDLKKRFSSINPSTYFFPSGVDFNHFFLLSFKLTSELYVTCMGQALINCNSANPG